MADMTPRQVVAELDRYIVGQTAAKKAVAVAIRNRWRRQQLPADLRKDVTPKNIILIGPTGVGKTEIARRLAQLVGAPFVKVEATKFTEVGYVGRDVESMIRDLTDSAVAMVKQRLKDQVREKAAEKVSERLLDLLVPGPKSTPWEPESDGEGEEQERRQRTREKMKARLEAGDLEDRTVELAVEQKNTPVQIFSNLGMENMDVDLQNMFEKIMPRNSAPRQLTIREARKVLLEQESEALIDRAAVSEQAVDLVENHGMVFLDEIDKICGPHGASAGPDVSRQGVQRDLLPVVEGTTVNTRHGPVKTDHILFIAAGAFHVAKPSDLMPELQGRFPIRVELTDLTRDDFLRILTEPKHALTKQYAELLKTEGVDLDFTPDGVEALADLAFELNRTSQNIGARRLHTILERVVEDVSFEGPDLPDKRVIIDGKLVREKIGAITKKDDLSKYIL
ncbi:ATP-dependent protease ATPase subunit HslU [Fimbriiglobus ruber]|uniref:ATP-dependent protease ATPase subunit HslU n=1 Tax=Fimbriiglobus ruber TaxID=1908690 RepID=A0A225DQ01_9BACT|nr:ATP-dependent protease ATPase subunit HslU [Fimbriiglobus ruber]OWK43193.1 ATP-dependent hsl protease ATP-binding subunit HslU [Fimbriiglobus ruber]